MTRTILNKFKSRLLRGRSAESAGGKDETIARLQQRLAGKDKQISRLRASLAGQEEGVKAGNIVWIFGSGRTGSTWLAAMMEEMEGHAAWREPLVGDLFGNFYYGQLKRRANTGGKHFIMGEAFRESWLRSMKNFVLSEATARFPEATSGGYVVVKEPNGTIGAPLLLEALPESRMILLVRDPRDVTASSMDARRKGGFRYKSRSKEQQARDTLPDTNPDTFAKKRAETYMQHVGSAKKAYDAHKGHKTLVRYEDLRADTLGAMKRLYSELGIPVDEGELLRSVGKHSWESIPEEEKGEGKFYRKATPGGWREDLTPEQARVVEEITGPLLKELYPDGLP